MKPDVLEEGPVTRPEGDGRTATPQIGCRRHGGCRPESRCDEHRVDRDPEPIGQIIARLMSRTGARWV